MINNAPAPTAVELPSPAMAYVLAGRDGLRSSVMTLNGRPLELGPGDTLPDLSGTPVAGTQELPPESCAFFVL